MFSDGYCYIRSTASNIPIEIIAANPLVIPSGKLT